MPEEFREKIFSKYGQVESRAYSSGLGLTFCRMVVESHGGSIGVGGRAEGSGSLFRFELPRERKGAPDGQNPGPG